MRIAGIVVAKEHSSRFPGKNVHPVDGKPMFWHAIDRLYELREHYDVDVCVATNSKEIKDCCKGTGISLVWRGDNVSEDEQPLFEVVKYAWQSLPEKYDVIVVILANSLGHKCEDIAKAVRLMQRHGLQEVRTVGCNGVENGVLVLREGVMTKHEVSTYVGTVTTCAKEIHYEEELG